MICKNRYALQGGRDEEIKRKIKSTHDDENMPYYESRLKHAVEDDDGRGKKKNGSRGYRFGKLDGQKNLTGFGYLKVDFPNGCDDLVKGGRYYEYHGEFKNNMFEGEGHLLVTDSFQGRRLLEYTGSFHEGKFEGRGEKISVIEQGKIEYYKGSFKNSIFNGKGIRKVFHFRSNGVAISYYQSVFKDGK